MRASAPTLELLVDYYAEMETNDPERYGAYYADDMTLRFANSPVITGRRNAMEAFSQVLGRVTSLKHDLVNVWEEDDGLVLFESVGTWYLRSGTTVSINAFSAFTVADGLFVDQRIYVDNAPLFAALEKEDRADAQA
ncbi:nuclear transport factor 2 family protein [Saccharopolyspora mangrovi]|uniref:Nuclear transport factor 2 family protein n=1 Tax=Saccharopolyspora mangrovi TaxID=3082379 RepID=A0ABU6ALA9_9PSEU|nr:nuclear transport factor 2 family protein [Saccharopolyspora sp. S2-29]MEB3372339.1 nuclear transport factor 2 family protein [Saccharopolyspora sp. S2-29]